MLQISDTRFDSTTSLAPDPASPGRFAAYLDEAWSSLTGVHGGYLSAVAIRAAEAVVGDRPIRTVSTTFVRPTVAGPATVDVDVLRRGRSVSNLTVTISQSAQVVVVSQITAAHAVESSDWETFAAPDLPPIDRCVPITPPLDIRHFDHGVAMLDPVDLPFSHGPRARVAGYLRPQERRPIDAAWLGMALDWFPPASFTRVDPPTGGISISYTVHVHRTLPQLDDHEWLGGVFHADISAGGIALEKGVVSDPGGRILAESFHTRWTALPRR